MLFKVCMLVVVATVTSHGAKGPTVPWRGMDASVCTKPGIKVVDNENLCWFHECVMKSVSAYRLVARRCPLGTRISYNFVVSEENPCVINYVETSHDYECSRNADSVTVRNPSCPSDLVCQNGGTLRVSVGKCWCDCPEEWIGDRDCSKSRNDLEPLEPTNKCVDGSDGIDHCAAAGGCLNGGTCVNQCGGYHCFCPTPYTKSKRCERFTCADEDDEDPTRKCLNGGQCSRGPHDGDEAKRCLCPPGTLGYQCEVDLRDIIAGVLDG